MIETQALTIAASLAAKLRSGTSSHTSIFRALHVETHPAGATLTTTDLDITLKVECRGTSTADQLSRAVVEAKVLADIVAAVKPRCAEVGFTPNEEVIPAAPPAEGAEPLPPIVKRGLHLTAGKRRLSLPQFLPIDDYVAGIAPKTPLGELLYDKRGVSDLAWVLAAASKDETRYNMVGIRIEGDRIAATDTHRLHLLEKQIEAPFRAIISRKTMELALAAFNATGADGLTIRGEVAEVAPAIKETIGEATWVTITCSGKGASVTIHARTIEGIYPPYQSVVPKEKGGSLCRLQASPFQEALALALKLHASEVKVHLNGAWDMSATRDKGSTSVFSERIEAKAKKELDIGFSTTYLLEAVTGQEGELVIDGTDSNSPIKVTSSSRPGRVAVVMPMRL